MRHSIVKCTRTYNCHRACADFSVCPRLSLSRWFVIVSSAVVGWIGILRIYTFNNVYLRSRPRLSNCCTCFRVSTVYRIRPIVLYVLCLNERKIERKVPIGLFVHPFLPSPPNSFVPHNPSELSQVKRFRNLLLFILNIQEIYYY